MTPLTMQKPLHYLTELLGRSLREWWTFDSAKRGQFSVMLLSTLIYNCLIGTVLSVIFVGLNTRATWWNTFFETQLVSHCIGFSIHFMMEGLQRVLLKRSFSEMGGAKRSVLIVSTMMLGVMFGYTVAFGLMGKNFLGAVLSHPRFFAGMLMVGLVGCMVWMAIVDSQARRLRSEADAAKAQALQDTLRAQASQAELRALQAQIEPHFLFNTLANVQALVDYEPQQAKRMLEAFIAYLRSTLDASRQSRSTLGEELELLRRYLEVMQVRMGERLQVQIDVPDRLLATPFAPLLLQPLVENAIKYGLEPKIEGGTVRISATELAGGRLQLAVLDDGVGLNAPRPRSAGPSGGTGMSNVRSRLYSLFGQNATLSIATKDQNTTTTIEFDPKMSLETPA